jgi:nucleotide-binding universal stress UspA family protein
VHVLHAEHLRAMLRVHHLDEVIEIAREEGTRLLAEVSARGPAPELQVVQALTVAEGLEAARQRAGAEGVIIGRAGRGLRHRVRRLGPVARRILRALSCPVLVVPSDVEAWRLGDGPIVALSSLASDSLAACRVASDLASTAGRELTVARVAPRREGPADLAGERRALERWMAYHGVSPRSAAVLEGDVVRSAARFADERQAPLVVVGAGGRSSRTFGRRIARELAAVAHLPVAIAPSPP